MDTPAGNGKMKVRLRSFSNSLPMSLLKARESVMQRFRSSLRLFNITEQQWRVLRALSSVESIEVTVLAKATFLLAPSLSRILKDLEERHLVIKTPVPSDLRRSLVSVTPDGLKLIDAVAPHSERIYSEITQAFGEEKMKLLQDLLKELETDINNLPAIVHDAADRQMPEFSQTTAGLPRGRPRKS
ncbi:MAG: homoprotocatechuate degradation operon regulator HpaR [Rhizobiaceae bacterium]|nr:homoprotocatechuate degradation operon regulator HpaR [Rhizobiaceae bacterium]|tara:strand:- start:44979 stop:45536 length:558 start_codon:yes stop_codon:yes gene_type:complete